MDQELANNTARCLTCGYLLHGLPEPVCPECGRAFDPSDESTFDARPAARRRRRRIKRGAVVLAVATLLFAFAPRGLLRGEIPFACLRCGEQTTFYRRELKAPRWVPYRYPSWHWTRRAGAPLLTPVASCRQHSYFPKFRVRCGYNIPTVDDGLQGRTVMVEKANELLRRSMAR